MSPPSIHLIEKLTTKDIEKLTELLRLPPGRLPIQEWLEDQAARISDLPSRLLKPNDPLLRLGMSLNIGPERATLCKYHKKLEPHLIRRIFLQISAECTTRLTRLLQNPYLSTDVASHVKRLQIINSLWMSVDLFRVTFQVMLQDPRLFRVPGDCEACILAAIGGNPHFLCDLRSSMLGRKKKRGKEPRILKLVEAWIKWTGYGPQITADSDILARQVRSCRRDMQLARRQTRRNQEDGIPEANPALFFKPRLSDASTLVAEDGSKDVFELGGNMSDDEESEDTIVELISHYADSIRSSTPLLRRPAREDDIHPAFRRSMTPQPSRRRPSDAPRPPTPGPAASMSTSYASITTIRPRLSTETLQRFDDDDDNDDDSPPRPNRPQNRSTYMDSMAGARMSRASAEVPPLRTRHQQAYTESAYSRDFFGQAQEDTRSLNTCAATVSNAGLDAGVHARVYEELLRRREEEYSMEGNPQNMYAEEEEVPPIPRRSERRGTVWPNFPEDYRRPHQDGW